MRTQIIIHERIGKWGPQVRPRVAGWPVKVHETRSMADLESVVTLSPCPIVLVNVAREPRLMMEHVAQARELSPDALILVVEMPEEPTFALLARELGATHCLPRPVLPPRVLSWLERWRDLAEARNLGAGWSRSSDAGYSPGIAPVAVRTEGVQSDRPLA